MNNKKYDLNLERRFLYNLLSDVFLLKPDRLFIEKINQNDVFDTLRVYLQNSKDINNLEKYIKLILGNNERINLLESTFENCFVVPVASYYIPPLMGAFVDYTQLRTSNAYYALAEELNSLYSLYGLSFNKRSDHISTIFAFMAHLINLELSQEIGLTMNEQKAFFQKYISVWVDKFFGEIKERCSEDFYRLWVLISEKFVLKEKELFLVNL